MCLGPVWMLSAVPSGPAPRLRLGRFLTAQPRAPCWRVPAFGYRPNSTYDLPSQRAAKGDPPRPKSWGAEFHGGGSTRKSEDWNGEPVHGTEKPNLGSVAHSAYVVG